jgi:hypothetical protein
MKSRQIATSTAFVAALSCVGFGAAAQTAPSDATSAGTLGGSSAVLGAAFSQSSAGGGTGSGSTTVSGTTNLATTSLTTTVITVSTPGVAGATSGSIGGMTTTTTITIVPIQSASGGGGGGSGPGSAGYGVPNNLATTISTFASPYTTQGFSGALGGTSAGASGFGSSASTSVGAGAAPSGSQYIDVPGTEPGVFN